MVALTAKLCLDGPVFPMPVEGYQVNAFVGVWKFKPFSDLSGYLAQCPDMSKEGSVFRLGLEIELNESLERATHSRLWRVASSVAKNPPRKGRRR